jgi:hypothetical protein
MSEPPLVSVCIPTRDRAAWLVEALDSVAAQTFRSYEVVVCDDASADDTTAVVQGRRDPRLRYRRHPRPLGVAANREACRALARGRYLAWLDSDDRYLPSMLAVQVAALEAHPRAAFAHGGCQVIDAEGRRLPDWSPPFAQDVVESGERALEELVTCNYVNAPTVVVRRAALDAAGPYRRDLESGEDWEMWLRLALLGDVVYTAEPLAQYRWHAGSLARSAEASGAQLRRDLRAVTGVLARRRLPRAAALRRRAGAGLAGRALLATTDHLTRGARLRALGVLLLASRARPPLAGEGAFRRAVAAVALGDEYRWHVASRALLRRLAAELGRGRLAARLRAALPDPGWDDTLRRIAGTVRAVVPPRAAIAAVDKWDPTLIHLARRRGWHFPDRRMLADGYPPDSDGAIAQLEALRRRGASYLVLPCASFWWLEHYRGLARHLSATAESVWSDERCSIFRLDGARSRRRAPAVAEGLR